MHAFFEHVPKVPNLKNIRFASTGAIKLRIRALKKTSKRIQKSIKNEGTKKRGQKAFQKSIRGSIFASKIHSRAFKIDVKNYVKKIAMFFVTQEVLDPPCEADPLRSDPP